MVTPTVYCKMHRVLLYNYTYSRPHQLTNWVHGKNTHAGTPSAKVRYAQQSNDMGWGLFIYFVSDPSFIMDGAAGGGGRER